MKQLILLSALLLLNIKLIVAQQASAGNGRIYGAVLDVHTGKPLPGVTIALLKMPDSSIVTGTMANEKGSFSFGNLAFGNYVLKCTYLGYNGKLVTNLHPREDKHEINAGDIMLTTNTRLLKTVEIVAHVEKPVVEDDGDKITYNVGESLTSEGDVLMDVLGKVPMVTVDAQGNVQLNGQNPLILIDGKPSSLGADAIMDILQSLPADAIEKIEVMENPPAKYQAQGSGGVVNIILKKGRRIGLNGRASLSAGTRNNYRGNVYASYRDRNTTISGILSSSYHKTLSNGYTDRKTFYTEDTLFTHQEFNNHSNSLSPYARINLDHDFSEKDNLTFTLSAAGSNASSGSLTTSSNMTTAGKGINDILQRQQDGHNHNMDIGLETKYTHTFDSLGQELSGEISYSPDSYLSRSDLVQSFLDDDYTSTRPDSIARVRDHNRSRHLGVDIDYDKPLKDTRSTFSAGYRGDFQLNDRNYLAEKFDADLQQYLKNDTASNHVQFINNVQALYVDFTSHIGSFRYRFGVRGEQNTTSFDLYDGGSNYKHTNFNLFPSVSLDQQLKDKSHLHLSYHMRINRPGLSQLNPYIYYIDPYNISYGNPSLKASATNEFQFGYSRFLPDNKFGISARLRYSHQGDISKRVTIVDSKGVAASTYKNIAASNSFGGHIYLSSNPFEGLNISLFVYDNITSYQRKDTFNILLHDASWLGGNANINYSFSKAVSAELSMEYNKSTTGQGIGYKSFSHSLAVRYMFPGNKFSLSLRARDPFRQSNNISQSIGNNFIIYTHTNNKSRYFSLTFSYRFNRIGRNNLDKQKSGSSGGSYGGRYYYHH